MPRPLVVLTVSVALLAAPACRDATAPGLPAGIYVLRDISQAAVPFTYYSAVDGTYTVLADTIELDGTGTAYRTLRIQLRQSIYEPDTVWGERQMQAYKVDGAKIEIGYFQPCPNNAICAANDIGTLLGGEMVLATGRTGQMRAWRYERIATP